MAIIKRRPLTPAQRFMELSRAEVDNKRPERSLTQSKHRAKKRCGNSVKNRSHVYHSLSVNYDAEGGGASAQSTLRYHIIVS